MANGDSFETAIQLIEGVQSDSIVISPDMPEQYFSIQVEPGLRYTFTVTSDGDPYGYLYGGNRNLLQEVDDNPNTYDPIIVHRSDKSEILYLKLRGYSATDTINFTVIVTSDAIVSVPGESFDNAITIEVNSTTPGQVDSLTNYLYYTFNLEMGQAYSIKTASDNNSDSYLRLYDANRNLIKEDDDSAGNRDALIEYEATYSGVYYAAVSPYSIGRDLDFTINLTVMDANAVRGIQFINRPNEFRAGTTIRLQWEIIPSTATNKQVTFRVNNTSLADITQTGVLTLKKAGNNLIVYVTTVEGNYEASISYNVQPQIYKLRTAQDVLNIKTGERYELMNDIDLSGITLDAGGNTSLAITLNGNGFALMNYTVTSEAENTGLFNRLHDSNITNLKLKNFNIQGKVNAGSLSGRAIRSTFRNIIVEDAYVSSFHRCGGFLGVADECNIREIYTNGRIEMLEGEGDPPNTGVLYNSHYCAGGVIGYTEDCEVLSSMHSDAHIHCYYPLGKRKVGGIIGHLYGSILTDAFFEGTITHDGPQGDGGGIIGDGTQYSSGRIKSRVERCYFNGSMRGGANMNSIAGNFHGEIIKNTFSISDDVVSYVNRSAYPSNYAYFFGDIMTTIYPNGSVYPLENTLTIEGYTIKTNLEASYELNTYITVSSRGSFTHEQARSQSFYESYGFDFENVWIFVEGYDYPRLRFSNINKRPSARSFKLQAVKLDEMLILS